jgi:two-component system sensor histidine kinase TctE
MTEFSLRRGLSLRVAAGIVLLLILDSIACYYLAAHFANLVYDRWLVDSARSLSKAVVFNDKVTFDLPNMALAVFQYDEVDKTYFRISSSKQGFIAGEATLPEAIGKADRDLILADSSFFKTPIRLVAVIVPIPSLNDVVSVEVGETVRKREQLTTEILIALAAPQIGLLIMALGLAWLSVSRGLKPLTDLANHIESRGYDNLTPLSQQGLPKETRILVHKINDLLSRLEHAMVMQKRFIADAAHQLRTPLTAIALYSERAQHADNPEDIRIALLGVRTTAERSVRVRQQLLALARLEPEARSLVELKKLDLVALARMVGEDWIPRALAEHIDFGLIVPDEAVMVDGNAAMLGELLSNLIDNAFRYSGPRSRVSLTVDRSAAPKIIVEDNGPGIPVEEQQKIFERFYRLNRDAAAGCGLGLSIVQQIAKLHQATVQVMNGSSGGTQFIILFPVTPC